MSNNANFSSVSPGTPAHYGLAWAPAPVLLLTILALWVADLRTPYESQTLLLFMNFVFTGLTSLCIAWMAGRSFLAGGQPGLIMLGCGVLLWGFTTLAASGLVNYGANIMVTIHNLGVLGAAACHLTGLLWRGQMRRPGRRLATGYAGVLVVTALLIRAAMAGWTPVFFVQGQGGTLVRQVVLVAAIVMFGLASRLMLNRRRQQQSEFLYWYGLGLVLLAIGLLGVMLQSVPGSALSWAGRASQFFGGGYMLVAALVSVREAGVWRISLQAAELDDRLLRLLTPHHLWSLHWGWRYGLAVAIAVAATVLRWAIVPWIGADAQYNVALIAIVITTILLGIGPGLLCVALADVMVEVFVTGSFATGPDEMTIARLAFSMSIGVLVVSVLYGTRVARLKSLKSEARLNALYASMTEGLASHEVVYAGGYAVDYILTDVNPAFERITGITRGQAIGGRASALFGSGEPPYLDVYARVAESGKSESFETDFALMGKSFHVSVFSPGKGRFATVFEDITERRQVEEALRASEEKAQNLIRFAPAAIYEMDIVGSRFLSVNDVACEWTGYSQGELLALKPMDLIENEGRSIFQDRIKRKLAGETVSESAEYKVITKDGHELIVAVNVGATLYEDGKPKSVTVIAHDITKRKKAEGELRYLAGLVESVSDAIISTDKDLKIRSWNKSAERMYGWQANEIIGLKGSDVLQTKFPEGISREAVAKDIFEKGGWEGELIQRTKDGREIIVQARSMALKNEAGAVIGGVSVGSDITKRKRMEEELHQSEERLRVLGDNLPDSAMYQYVHELDDTPRFLYVSAGMERMNGVRAADVLRDAGTLHRQIVPEYIGQLIEAEARSKRDLSDFNMEVPMRLSDGTVRWMHLRSRPRRLPDGRTLWDGVQTDITERRQIEQELERMKDLLAEGQRVAHVGSFEYVASTQTTMWSEEEYRIYGLDPAGPSPAYDVMLAMCIHPDDAARLHHAFSAAMQSNSVYELEHRIVRPDGSVRWVYDRALPFFDDSGKLLRYVGATLDITERKHAEGALNENEVRLREANAELQQRIAEERAASSALREARSAAVNLMKDAVASREQAQQAEEAIKASLHEKEVLLKEIHHRVKNNMQVMSSLVSLQADAVQDPAMRNALEDLSNRVRSMAMIHEKLYQSPNLAMVEFSEYSRSLLSYLWRAHGESGSRVQQTLELNPVQLPVSAAVPCGLILNELVSNSLKHAFAGQKKGQVKVSLKRDPEGNVRLSVADNGPGLPEGFDWRKTSSLGLRLVQMLAGQLHAEVKVSGEGGTKFEIVFKTE